MSSEFLPISRQTPAPPEAWAPHPGVLALSGAPPIEASESAPWLRYVQAVWRYKWLIALLTALSVAAGVAGTRLVRPTYEARATIWISASTPPAQRASSGPIRAEELLASTSWVELLRSFAIVDTVVSRRRLFAKPERIGDSLLFAQFAIGPRVVTDNYVLISDTAARRWSLRTSKGIEVETGAFGDSIGRRAGMLWAPDAQLLAGHPEARFRLTTLRDASLDLLQRVEPSLAMNSNFLRLSLSGTDPVEAAATLNVWLEAFVSTAAELKRRNLREFSNILDEQLRYAERELRHAEIALETFRVNTITLPAEITAIQPGVEATKGPVFKEFFDRKIEFDNARRDRAGLEQLSAEMAAGTASAEAVAAMPNILSSAGSEALAAAVKELFQKQAELRVAERTYTNEHRTVQTLREDIRVLRAVTVPQLTADLLRQLRRREIELGARVDSASKVMRGIPSRTIEEMRLRREVAVSENLYTSLQNRYEEAKLAEASSVPDISILDRASTPERPTSNLKMQLVAVALLAGLGLGVLVAVGLDYADRRFRYPSQVTGPLQLNILGTVPPIRQRRGRRVDEEEAAQVLESFRSIRLRLQHEFVHGSPIVCTVTSADGSDGKSMIASNLALSLAEAGYKTLLIDGDTRRGVLHETFGAEQRPGLIERLSGAATSAESLRATTHPLLTFMPSGMRRRNNAEVLAGAALPHLVHEMRHHYDALVIDSPPMSAGIDAFALAAAAGSTLIVLRHAKTDLKMTEAKLALMRRLPISVLGAVLNDVESTGMYRYHTYYATGYAVDSVDEQDLSSVGRLHAPT